MRKSMIIFMSAALLAGTALTGSAIARDRSDRSELTANQMADRADAQTAKLKVDLNLTADQEENWSGFASAMQDMSRKHADHRIAMRDARAQHGPFLVSAPVAGAASRLMRDQSWRYLSRVGKFEFD